MLVHRFEFQTLLFLLPSAQSAPLAFRQIPVADSSQLIDLLWRQRSSSKACLLFQNPAAQRAFRARGTYCGGKVHLQQRVLQLPHCVSSAQCATFHKSSRSLHTVRYYAWLMPRATVPTRSSRLLLDDGSAVLPSSSSMKAQLREAAKRPRKYLEGSGHWAMVKWNWWELSLRTNPLAAARGLTFSLQRTFKKNKCDDCARS